MTAVTNLEALGNKISNPQTCNRNYVEVYTNKSGTYKAGIHYSYSTFCGFYMVN